jgi:nucleolar protein 12
MEDLEERYLRQKLDVSVSKAKGRKDAEKGASRVTINRDSKDSKDIESSQVLNGSEGSEYQSSEDATDGEDLDPASLVHETVSGAKSGRSTKKKKVHYVPENETKEQRDQRTVFIGNLPPDVLKSKVSLDSLYPLLLS